MSILFLEALVNLAGCPYKRFASSTLILYKLYKLRVLLWLTSIYSSYYTTSRWLIVLDITSSS